MNPEGSDTWERLVRGLRSGEDQAAREFWQQYGDLLHQFAEKHLAAGLRRRVGPEDVVQSVCCTFLRRVCGGEFQFTDDGGVWKLLCAITLAKVREQTRFHFRRKRGLGQEVNLPHLADDGGADQHADPAEAAEFADYLEQTLAGLDEEERRVVGLKLQELTDVEVADRVGSSERTVRRILKRI